MVVGQFWPVIGGSENQCRRLAAQLVREGIDVEVWTRRIERSWPREEQIDGVRVRRLGPAGPIGGLRVRRIERYLFALALAVRLLRGARRFDVIHVHQVLYPALIASVAARLAHRPCVARVACSGSYSDFLWLRRAWGLPLMTIRRLLTRIVAMDPVGREECRAAGLRPDQIVEIPNGVAVPQERTDRAAGTPEFITVSGLRPQKRIEILLRAWAEAGEPGRLRIVGEGSERARLEEECRRLKLARVELTGAIAEPSPLLQCSDVFVSSSEAEGMSNALLEAMAAGCACVVTAVGGNVVALGGDDAPITPGTFRRAAAGLLVAPEDVAGLAAALRALAESAALRRELGQLAHQRCRERFALRAVADQYKRLYDSLAANRK
jgi:glycosyltransferase involved in cell wall biosynthesis